ncbi:MAG: bifunctional adenosylcobinamide kinase/adenosylcobinamide-phosphate guanylyltransferase [Candidatus Cyclobacteriaceae bacterium M3_2C_046]
MITFITGGQRSGKSSFGQQLARQKSTHPIYLATSRVWDQDHQQRIKRHQQDRGPEWQVIEREKYFDEIEVKNKVVLLDCITLWLTNFFHDHHYQVEPALNEAKQVFDRLLREDMELILISNELGMGLHAETPSGRKFTDLQGWMNQYIAAKADQVFFMVSGIPWKIKG